MNQMDYNMPKSVLEPGEIGSKCTLNLFKLCALESVQYARNVRRNLLSILPIGALKMAEGLPVENVKTVAMQSIKSISLPIRGESIRNAALHIKRISLKLSPQTLNGTTDSRCLNMMSYSNNRKADAKSAIDTRLSLKGVSMWIIAIRKIIFGDYCALDVIAA